LFFPIIIIVISEKSNYFKLDEKSVIYVYVPSSIAVFFYWVRLIPEGIKEFFS